MPTLLALDTAAAACSAALWSDGAVRAHRRLLMDRGHAEALVPLVIEVMTAAGMAFDGLDGLAVTTGPGAFTGLRIGLATARGMALATGRPCLGVTTFETIAHALPAGVRAGRPVLVVLETKRADLYAQVFGGDLAPASAPTALAPEALAALAPAGPFVVAGDALARVRDAAGFPVPAAAVEASSDAAALAAIAAARWRPGIEVPPPAPLYLRPPDARLPPSAPGSLCVPVRRGGAMTVDLIPASPVHSALLAALRNACFDREPATAPDTLARLLAQPGMVAVIAAAGPEPVGFVLGQAAADDAEVVDLGVVAGHRRRGIARALLAALAAEVARRGATALFLDVAVDNGAARALYTAAGFLVVGRRPRYYHRPDGWPVDALVMRKSL